MKQSTLLKAALTATIAVAIAVPSALFATSLIGCSSADRKVSSAPATSMPAGSEGAVGNRSRSVRPINKTAPTKKKKPSPGGAKVVAGIAPTLGKALGNFHLTYYWVANESGDKRANVVLRNRRCKPIAKVSRKFRRTLLHEGTGRTRSGLLVNVAGKCRCGGGRCFMKVPDEHPHGMGIGGRTLEPFRSVSAPPHIEVGTLMYFAELDGLPVPGLDAIHDGCVIAADRGGGVKGMRLDLFTGEKGRYERFFQRHRINKIKVNEAKKRCIHLADPQTPAPVAAPSRPRG